MSDRRLDIAKNARTLIDMGDLRTEQARYDEALALFEEALTLVRAACDRDGEAETLNKMGIIHKLRGAYDQALKLYHVSAAIACEIGDRVREALALGNIANVLQLRGQSASSDYENILTIFREVGDRGGGKPIL